MYKSWEGGHPALLAPLGNVLRKFCWVPEKHLLEGRLWEGGHPALLALPGRALRHNPELSTRNQSAVLFFQTLILSTAGSAAFDCFAWYRWSVREEIKILSI